MWTAEEAAKRSQYYQHETTYNFICDEIRTAVCAGKREYVFPEMMLDSVKDEFRALGYTVLEEQEYRDGVVSYRTCIMWGGKI